VFNTAAGVLAQGGRRRGASMAVLDVCRPDIGEFIDARQAGGLEYFNLSVAVTSRFMPAVTRGGRHRPAASSASSPPRPGWPRQPWPPPAARSRCTSRAPIPAAVSGRCATRS
jgi:hypothetical protein